MANDERLAHRVLTSLDDDDLQAVDVLAAAGDTTRAGVLRQALRFYLRSGAQQA
jgi:predicted transcriptional regulator